MRRLDPAGLRRGRSRVVLSSSITWIIDNSVVLYFAAMFAQRIWGLLNSDIGQLIRRG
jgi:hypothetical protein